MTTTHRPPAVHGAPASLRPVLLVLAAVAVLVAVGCLTLGPSGFVADARRTVTAGVEALAAPWPGGVHRTQVEAVANVLLFVPVGALGALALRRRTAVLPLAFGAGASVLIELAQTALPGRVPDLVDVAANTAGTAVGVALTTALLAFCQVRRVRQAGRRRHRRGLRTALVAAPLLMAGSVACSPDVLPSSVDARDAYTSGGGALTFEDGYVADDEGLSAFADVPAITRLDSALRQAVQDASTDATTRGVDFHVTTGWRSAAYQQALFDAAVQEYGSPEAARVHVLRPEESAHVSGHAVDVGPTDAMYWLAQHGSAYGLCQTYANEIWHYELAAEPGGTCPEPAADPSAG